MIAYADTGFLISLYGQDDHSAAATALVMSKPVFMLTSVSEAEFTNAVELQVVRKQWTRREARLVHEHFLQHEGAGVFQKEPLCSGVWEKALILSRRYSAKLGTRTLDLLHVAAALFLKPDGSTATQEFASLSPPFPRACRRLVTTWKPEITPNFSRQGLDSSWAARKSGSWLSVY